MIGYNLQFRAASLCVRLDWPTLQCIDRKTVFFFEQSSATAEFDLLGGEELVLRSINPGLEVTLTVT